MVDEAGSSSTALSTEDKPVIVTVKRKSYQSPVEAFCEFRSSFALCGKKKEEIGDLESYQSYTSR